MREIKTVLGRGGRISIPSGHRKALGLREGEEVIVGMADEAIRIESRDAAIERAQRLARARLGEGRTPFEELIRERREEAAREAAREALGHG